MEKRAPSPDARFSFMAGAIPNGSPSVSLVRAILLLNLTAGARQSCLEPLAISEFGKLGIARVGPCNPRGMLDRAPLGFGAAGNFTHPGDHPVAIAAVDAIQFLHPV